LFALFNTEGSDIKLNQLQQSERDLDNSTVMVLAVQVHVGFRFRFMLEPKGEIAE
jgi:hypothetical protein